MCIGSNMRTSLSFPSRENVSPNGVHLSSNCVPFKFRPNYRICCKFWYQILRLSCVGWQEVEKNICNVKNFFPATGAFCKKTLRRCEAFSIRRTCRRVAGVFRVIWSADVVQAFTVYADKLFRGCESFFGWAALDHREKCVNVRSRPVSSFCKSDPLPTLTLHQH